MDSNTIAQRPKATLLKLNSCESTLLLRKDVTLSNRILQLVEIGSKCKRNGAGKDQATEANRDLIISVTDKEINIYMIKNT